MKICLISQQHERLWSGVGTYTKELVQFLVGSGHDVTLITQGEGEKNRERLRILNLPEEARDPTPGKWLSLSFKVGRIFSEFIRRESFDLIHFTDAREALFFRDLEIPSVGTLHDSYAAEASGNPFSFLWKYADGVRRYFYYHCLKNLERKAYRKLTFLIANSLYVKKAVVRRYGIPPEKIKVVYNGIAGGSPCEERPRVVLEGKPRILFVGSNFYRKGLPLVIKAVSRLREDFPHIRLTVIGTDRNGKKLEKILFQRGLENTVQFLGWQPREKVLQYYPLADLFVMPSQVEAFGLTYLEAMREGIPVIGSSRGGVRELIRDGINGFLVNPDDWKALAEKMALLTKDPELYKRISLKARERASRFTLERMGKHTLNAYYHVLDRKQIQNQPHRKRAHACVK